MSIEDVVSRADLADRGIFLTLAPIGAQGALLDAAVHGLQTLPNVRLTSFPRMADFALWATACGTALWPAGTFARAYDANERGSWAGTASELLRAAIALPGDDISIRSAGWPKNPSALAGRLRRAQTFLGVLGIEISFSREGRAGTRTIRVSAATKNRARRRKA
jgi:hypothetical protein